MPEIFMTCFSVPCSSSLRSCFFPKGPPEILGNAAWIIVMRAECFACESFTLPAHKLNAVEAKLRIDNLRWALSATKLLFSSTSLGMIVFLRSLLIDCREEGSPSSSSLFVINRRCVCVLCVCECVCRLLLQLYSCSASNLL